MRISKWDVLVVKHDDGCESHYRKPVDESGYIYYDCYVAPNCKKECRTEESLAQEDQLVKEA